MFEEPQRLKEILIKDVLNRSTTLADNKIKRFEFTHHGNW